MKTNLKHKLTTTNVPSKCGVPGHNDCIIECSCGWKTYISHSYASSKDVDRNILYHRLTALEEAIGMKFVVNGG